MVRRPYDAIVGSATRAAPKRRPRCLVVWDRERLQVLGEMVGGDGPARHRLVCESWAEYAPAGEVSGDAQWIEIDRRARTVRVRISDFGARPLFYYLDRSLCIIAPAILPIAEALVERGISVEWDRAGILEALLEDHPFRHRTYLRGIERGIMGEELLLRLDRGEVERSRTWTMRFAAPDEPSRKLSDAVELLRTLTEETPLPEGAVHPLSGGYDSRLLLCLAVAEGRRPRTLTFGEYGSADLTIARRLADLLGVPNETYAQRPEDLWTHGMDVSILSGGMVTPAHRHIYSMLHDMQVEAPLVHGFYGESLAGQSAVACEPARSEKEVFDGFLGRLSSAPKPIIGSPSRTIWEGVDQRTREVIEGDVQVALRECASVNPPSVFPEYFHNVERQSAMVAQVISMFELFGPCTHPFATRRFAEFFNAAPIEDRRHRRLFVDAASQLFPQAFALPSLDRPCSANLPWRLQCLRNTGRNALQLGTDLLSGGRLVAFSPYWTEQHDYLIGQHYRAALGEAIEAAEGLLDTDLSSLRYSRVPKWRNAYRQLRLIGLHGLMRHETYRALTGRTNVARTAEAAQRQAVPVGSMTSGS